MSEIFLQIINMSISASYIVLAVLLLRLLLKKAPKWITVVLWGIVAIRLICPFSIESALSLIPSTEIVSVDIMTDQTPTIHTGVPIINATLNPVISQSFAPNPGDSANPLQIWIPILAAVWIAGIIALLIYTIISYWRVRRKIGTAVHYKDNIYQSENVASPFVLGIIKPKIYLPFNMNEKDMAHVVAHETTHIRRKDHLWKPLGFLLLTLHWFNPLMWLGYILLCRDIELACDEKVIKALDRDARANYSEALLACSVNRRMIAACPLAFGEVGVKDRIKSVLSYKKPAFWVIIAAVVACVAVAVCFLTNPQQSVKDILVPNTSWKCEEFAFAFQMDQDYIIEGNINTANYNGNISVGFRYAGKNAVAEIFMGDWEYAQSAAEEPLLSGTFRAKGDKLIFEITEDNVGLSQKELTFYQTELLGIDLSAEICTDYEGVYVTVRSVDTNARGYTVFNLLWHNETSENVMYGEHYCIERKVDNRWVSTASEALVFNDIGYLLNANRKADKSYSTQRFDISQNGTYRLIVYFFVDKGNGYTEHCTWTEFKVDAISTASALSEQHPEYFGLDASDGLDVYVWQMATGSYSFGLLPHSEQGRDWISQELLNLRGASAEEMRAILSTYNVNEDDIYIIPWQNPFSSYLAEWQIVTDGEDINAKRQAYVESIRLMLSPVAAPVGFIYDTATFDIDNDGIDEVCTMSMGRTSGVFTFTFNARQVGAEDVEYHTIIFSQWYDLSFQKGSDGITRVQGITLGENPITRLFDISIKDGYICLTENGVPIGEIN